MSNTIGMESKTLGRKPLGTSAKQHVAFRLDERVIVALRALAKRKGQSMAIVIEDAICSAAGRAPLKRRPRPIKRKAKAKPKVTPAPKPRTKKSAR
jgi:hypothetical protein